MKQAMVTIKYEEEKLNAMTVLLSGRHYYGAGWNFCVKTIR